MISKHKYKYIIFDFIAAIIVWVLFVMYVEIKNDVLFNNSFFIYSNCFWKSILVYSSFTLFIHYLTGFYNSTVARSRILDLFASIASSFFLSLTTYIVVDRLFFNAQEPKLFFILFLLQFLIVYIVRSFITQYIFRQYRTEKIVIPILVIGTGISARDLISNMAISKYFIGRKLVGYIAITDKIVVNEEEVLGKADRLEEIVNTYGVKEVVIAVDNLDDHIFLSLVNRLLPFDVNILVTPRLCEIIMGNVMLGDITSEPLVSIARSRMPAWQESVKRIFDIVFSVCCIILLSPVYFYLMIRVKLDSKGSIFYKQERVGYKGREFKIIKFRTMVSDAENGIPKLTTAHDTRITRFGNTMRKYRLDELPQLWNIIKGEMSVVGPRPERRFFINKIEQVAPYYCFLYNIRPGLLSWGPIKVGYADSIDKMVDRLKYDIIYMNNMSLVTDIKIMLYSINVIYNGKGQ